MFENQLLVILITSSVNYCEGEVGIVLNNFVNFRVYSDYDSSGSSLSQNSGLPIVFHINCCFCQTSDKFFRSDIEDVNVLLSASCNNDIRRVDLCCRQLCKGRQFDPSNIDDLPALNVIFCVKHFNRYLLDCFVERITSKDEKVLLLESAGRVLEPSEDHRFNGRPNIVIDIIGFASF